MEQEVDQIVQAILVASDPTQASLHQQALEYLATIQKNANETWRLGLALFVDVNADASGSRKHPPQARFFGLRVLDDFLDSKFEPLDANSFQTLQQGLVNYIQSEFIYGPAEAAASFLRNKFSHTMTLFFLCTYLDQWPTFFTDLFTLIRPQSQASSQDTFNPHVSLLLFHLITEISGEVADQMLKSARSFNVTRHARDGKVRDAVRERDAPAINEAVLTIVADAANKLTEVRKSGPETSTDRLVEVVDWGIRAFGSYVGWIDINLTVTPTTIPLLFSLLNEPSLPIRLATSVALLRMVSKGLKEPSDKLQLIKVLSLGQVLAALEQKTRAEQIARGDETDEGEESYREALGRLLNGLGLELAKLSEENITDEAVRREASGLLVELHPVIVRFLSDQYDDTCSTVFPLLSQLLSTMKKAKRSSDQIDEASRAFLVSILSALLEKMKWDEEEDPNDMDEDDKQAFESLRKNELRSHLDSILVIDQALVMSTVHTLVMNTLAAYESGSTVKWNDAELAIYLIYLFGEINKSGGKGRAAFCQSPAVAKEARKHTDYSEYPLTVHGEMLFALIRCGIANFSNPVVVMQFFEACARYGDFFKVRKECIIPLLEAMVGERGIHNSDSSVRSRVFYLLYKFLKEDRNEISPQVAETLLNGIRDVLPIQVELPEVEGPDVDILAEAVSTSTIFDHQLYLFESAGILISLTFKTPEKSEALLLSVVDPLLEELSRCLQAVKGPQDVLPIVKVHHIIMALGNVAKGFPETPSPVPETYILPPIAVFRRMAQAIIFSLEAMNVFKIVRDATRFAFARIVATTGSSVIDFIPTLMSDLLAHFEPTEIVDFMSFISLLMHRLQTEISDVVNQLVGPLHERIMSILSQPVAGTDDKNTHIETKKAYLAFLNNIMINKLHGVFLTDVNKTWLPGLLESMLQVSEDTSDPVCARTAVQFLGRCILSWSQSPTNQMSVNGTSPSGSLPGFEQFMYERLVPMAFRVVSSPSFNLKDGQSLLVLHEIATMLQNISKARGEEAFNYLVNAFLPSQNCPPDTAMDFATKMRDMDSKAFRKFFADFVRASRQ